MISLKKVSILAGSLALITSGFTGVAVAAHRTGALSLTPGLGYFWFSDKQELHNAAVPNIAIGYDTSPNLTVQFLMGEFHASYKNRGTSGSADGAIYWGDGIWHFNAGHVIEPYILGGVGITDIDHPAGNNPSSLANVNAGGGIEAFAAPSISVHVDLRDAYTMSGGKNDWFANFGVSVLLFGNKNAPAVAAS